MYKRFAPAMISGFWFVVMISIWLAFAPRQAGGLASYIIIIGNSMEPDFHIGDLVIVHDQAQYRPGDAVVYRNLELDNFVFHRILSESPGRFTLKGDNNSWTDTYQPAREEILGKLWLHLPNGGRILQRIRNPFIMAGIAGALGAILAMGLFTGKKKGKHHMNRDWFKTIKQKLNEWFPGTRSFTAAAHVTTSGKQLEGAFFALGLVAFGSLMMGMISFSRPAHRTVEKGPAYDQLGIFAYSASAPQGVYDANSIKSGDPIFPKLTCFVDVTFQYSLLAQEARAVSGSYQMTATISEPLSGWQRSVPLQDKGIFTGNIGGTTAKLDLCGVERLTQAMEQGTDFHPGVYTLTVSPNVNVTGELAGQALGTSFNPHLTFIYDRVHFYLAKEGEQTDAMSSTQPGILSDRRLEANTLSLFGLTLEVPFLRILAITGFIAALAGLIWLFARLQNMAKDDPVQFIRARYDTSIIDIQNLAGIKAENPVEVSSIDDLAKLAEKFNAAILHFAKGRLHSYYVSGEATVYRFVLTTRETESNLPVEEASA